MKRAILALSVGCGLVGVVGHFYAKPVLAQVRATLIKNLDERGRNPYVQTVECYSASQSFCSGTFPAVPPNMRLVVEHVSGIEDGTTSFVLMGLKGNGNIQQFPFFNYQSTSNTLLFYVTNQPLLTYFEAGQTPNFYVEVANSNAPNMGATITLTGYLVNVNE